MRRGYEELLVYRRAGALADEIRDAVISWPSVDAWTCGVQLIRAADSIPANLAEANGRRTTRDQLRFILIARGSVEELENWLIRARARKLTLPEDARARAKEIGRMLNGLMRGMR